MPLGVAIFIGGNAQGKTNLLEAIYLLATTRSPRAGAEVELLHRETLNELLPFARVEAEIWRQGQLYQMSQVLQRAPGAGEGGQAISRRLRVNGAPKRAWEWVGLLPAVWFSPQDVDLIATAPAARRRFLDILNSQIAPPYLRTLSRYQRVLEQRNRLLKLIREGRATASELEVWDEALVAAGSYILRQRLACLETLAALAEAEHQGLTGEAGLALDYRPSFQASAEVEASYRSQLQASREREVRLATTLIGPHRDDLRFHFRGLDMSPYGSRGEHRTIALSLRLAEAELLRRHTGTEPVLLLDDALSELDESRSRHLLGSIQGRGQVLITATDRGTFPPAFLEGAARFQVQEGRVGPI